MEKRYGTDKLANIPRKEKEAAAEVTATVAEKLKEITPPAVEMDESAGGIVENPQVLPPRLEYGDLKFSVRLTALKPLDRFRSGLRLKTYDTGGAILDEDSVSLNVSLATGERGLGEFRLRFETASKAARFKIFSEKTRDGDGR